jgi:hypothetical protein
MGLKPGQKLKLRTEEYKGPYTKKGDKFLDKYFSTYYKEEGEKDRIPYAGEDKISGLVNFLKAQYSSQDDLTIKDSKEWEIYKKSMGKDSWGMDRYPVKPSRIQSNFEYDVRMEEIRRKKHPEIPNILVDDRENRISRYKKDRKSFEDFMENLSTKSSLYDSMIKDGWNNASVRHFWKHEDITDLYKNTESK